MPLYTAVVAVLLSSANHCLLATLPYTVPLKTIIAGINIYAAYAGVFRRLKTLKVEPEMRLVYRR